MQTYIIIFTSNTRSEALISIIKAFSGWGKITANAWVVKSYLSAVEIRDALVKTAASGDTVFVVKSGTVAAWSNVAAKNEWLKENL